MKKTVLIIEDNQLDIELLTSYLTDEFNVLKAMSGKDGLAILKNNYKNLSTIFLDLIMPTMDGFEVLQQIKDNPLYHHIPIIITTSLDDQESIKKAYKLGAVSFVTKPFDKEILITIFKNLVNVCQMTESASILYKDKITGLFNRDTFIAEAEKLIKKHENNYYILSYINIEKFKVINEQLGTDAGDNLLRHVGECLNEIAITMDGIASRNSGDHFAILFPAKYSNSELVNKFQKRVSEIDFLKNPITLRIGRYHISNTSIPVTTMCDKAMMAESTIIGKYGIYVSEYTEEMNENLIQEQDITNRMEKALKNNEFEAWYQPQYNHATQALIGAEALARWRDSKTGQLIPPYKFIPIFEKNGFIYELDKYIWEEVCAKLNKWIVLQKENQDFKVLPVSVNISRIDIFHKDFYDTIINLVEKYKIPKDLLRLEVTESAFAEATNEIVNKVKKLLDYGLTIEIDDFGSGYSSLNTLKDVPAQILKLDMKFFEDNGNVERGGNIIESVVRMAKWLGMAVIAEGVEEESQADFLKTIGCYYIQGYFYSKPVPLAEFETLLFNDQSEPKLDRLIKVKELNNSKFWDPKSMDTFIFNSYIGGACIFEYYNDNTELIRANDRYFTIFKSLIPTGSSLKHYTLRNFVSDEDRKAIIDIIKLCIELKTDLSGEFKLGKEENKQKYVRLMAKPLLNKLLFSKKYWRIK